MKYCNKQYTELFKRHKKIMTLIKEYAIENDCVDSYLIAAKKLKLILEVCYQGPRQTAAYAKWLKTGKTVDLSKALYFAGYNPSNLDEFNAFCLIDTALSSNLK